MSKTGIKPYTAAPAPTLTAAAITELQRDHEQLQAVINLLNLNDIGDTSVLPVYRVKSLLQRYQQQRNVTVKLIARKRPGAVVMSNEG